MHRVEQSFVQAEIAQVMTNAADNLEDANDGTLPRRSSRAVDSD